MEKGKEKPKETCPLSSAPTKRLQKQFPPKLGRSGCPEKPPRIRGKVPIVISDTHTFVI